MKIGPHEMLRRGKSVVRKYISGCLRLEVRSGQRGSFWGKEMFKHKIKVMVTGHSKFILKNHLIVYFKWLNFLDVNYVSKKLLQNRG